MLKHKNKEEKRINQMFRSPTLDTVSMVENVCNEYSGEFNRRKIWEKLPRRVMWGTFTTILNYLQEINKILITDKGIIVYIWNPKLAKKYMGKEGLKYEKN